MREERFLAAVGSHSGGAEVPPEAGRPGRQLPDLKKILNSGTKLSRNDSVGIGFFNAFLAGWNDADAATDSTAFQLGGAISLANISSHHAL